MRPASKNPVPPAIDANKRRSLAHASLQKFFPIPQNSLAHHHSSCILQSRTGTKTQTRASIALGGRLVKIVYVISSLHPPRADNLLNKEKRSQANALASSSCDLFHGFGRHLRHRTNHLRRRLRSRNSDSVVPSNLVVPSDRLHDRRTFQRAAL